jgi:hypothetical protein
LENGRLDPKSSDFLVKLKEVLDEIRSDLRADLEKQKQKEANNG